MAFWGLPASGPLLRAAPWENGEYPLMQEVAGDWEDNSQMIPLLVLAVAFAAFWLTGLGVPYFANWPHALRAALGVMFLLTASAHWGRRRPDLMRMVPRRMGDAGTW